MSRRQSNRPERRLTRETLSAQTVRTLLKRLSYAGDGHHKLHPGNYGFVPPINPRPSKSACDDLRPILAAEAIKLFRAGVRASMVSRFAPGATPKYVWAVDRHGEVYEAKTKPPDHVYHGYRLGDDDADMRRYILEEWRQRCRAR